MCRKCFFVFYMDMQVIVIAWMCFAAGWVWVDLFETAGYGIFFWWKFCTCDNKLKPCFGLFFLEGIIFITLNPKLGYWWKIFFYKYFVWLNSHRQNENESWNLFQPLFFPHNQMFELFTTFLLLQRKSRFDSCSFPGHQKFINICLFWSPKMQFI